MKIIIATIDRVADLGFFNKNKICQFTKVSSIDDAESCGTSFKGLYQELHQ